MDSGELRQLKKQILDRMMELQALLNGDAASHPAEKQKDNPSATEVDQQIIQQLKRELVALDKSLERLNTDDAGICERCGCEIPFARLQAVPVTALCVNCAD